MVIISSNLALLILPALREAGFVAFKDDWFSVLSEVCSFWWRVGKFSN